MESWANAEWFTKRPKVAEKITVTVFKVTGETNSVQWFMGDDIPFVPNKRTGGVCIGSKIAPIFFNTMEDSGAFPIEINVENMHKGDVIDIYPYEGVVKKHGTEEVITNFELKTQVLL